MTTNPTAAGRPRMPADYQMPSNGSGEAALPWRTVDEWLEQARNYWIATASPDGQPHAVPVWGVWVDGAVYFGTDRQSRKARNLAADPRVVVHLDSGDDVVILRGEVREATDAAVRERVLAAYGSKYDMPPGDQDGSLFYELRPRVALTWREQDFHATATRWEFG